MSLRISREETTSRFAFVIPKNVVKKATARNKIRRRGYHVLAELAEGFEAPMRVVVFARGGIGDLSFQALRKELKEALVRARILS